MVHPLGAGELGLRVKAIFFEYALLCNFCPLIYHVFVEVVFSGIQSKNMIVRFREYYSNSLANGYILCIQ